MKIDKKLIKELVEYLREFNLSELEYQDGETKIKVSKASKGIESLKTGAMVSPNKSVLKSSEDSEGTRINMLCICFKVPGKSFTKLRPSMENTISKQLFLKGISSSSHIVLIFST